MRDPWGDRGKKQIRVGHNRKERNHCRNEKPEILNQVIGLMGLVLTAV